MEKFSEDSLRNYLSSGKVPGDAMIWLNQLLFEKLGEYCDACEDDRMICVLAPMCDARILLKVRIQANATSDQIPKFCYGQYVNNVRRYIEKRTVLYAPVDNWLYNKDFIDILLPNLYLKIIQNYITKPERLHQILNKSKVPAVNFNFTAPDVEIFQKIIRKDKLIREGTFIYHLAGENLLIWFDNDLYLVDFATGITTINAKFDVIKDIGIIELIFKIYAAEVNLSNYSTAIDGNSISFEIKIPMKEIAPEKLDDNSPLLPDFIDFLQKHFYEIKIESKQKYEEYFVLSVKYNIVNHFLERKGLNSLTYDALHNVLITFKNFSK